MPDLGRLLIVEDTPSLARTYEAHLRHDFSEVVIADSGAQAVEAVDVQAPDCVLLDLKLPDADGLELLDRWVDQGLKAPVIVITANGSMSVAVDAMRRGAVDFRRQTNHQRSPPRNSSKRGPEFSVEESSRDL